MLLKHLDMKKTTKPANLTQMLRETENLFVGFCADESIRIGRRSDGSYIQLPVGHAQYARVLESARTKSDKGFEFDCNDWIYSRGTR